MGDRVGYRSVVQPDGVTDDLGLVNHRYPATVVVGPALFLT